MPVNDCIEALESDLAKYVIDRKVDESMKRYLRWRVYPLASILGAALVFFGIRLGSLYEDYAKLQKRADESAVALAQQTRIAEEQLGAIKDNVTSLETTWQDAREKVDKELEKARTTLEVQNSFLKSNYDRQNEATSQATKIAAGIDAALTRVKLSEETAKNHANKAFEEAENAGRLAANATLSKKTIDDARTAAKDYQAEVAAQQSILGMTIVDFVLLARKIPSTVTLQNPHDPAHPIVLRLTPQSVSQKGFSIDVLKNGLPQEPLVMNPNMFGQWQELPMTDGLYRCMIDFVYHQRGVRDFVVMRFGGSPKLFEKPKRAAVAGETGSR